MGLNWRPTSYNLIIKYLEGASGDVRPVESLLALLGSLAGGVLGVAEVFARQRVNVDQLAKAAKGVLQDVRRQRAWMTNDEQTLGVSNRVVEFADCGLDGWQRDIDRVEGGVDIRFPRRRSSVIARWIRDEFGHEPAAGRILESTQLLVSVLSPTLGRERRFKCGRGSHVATFKSGDNVTEE